MTEPEWTWDYAFHTEDELSYPKAVLDEVRAVADRIVELANLGIDPTELGEETAGTARHHHLPCGGWFETQALHRSRPRRLLIVEIVPPLHML
ncbi:hypothetical protein [Streptomyces lavendulae]|uniref:hypothetical protein n=1 Tax=Streptomyces lavendulae TaxID=1914 RepID=UPI0024A59D27|nr:hypothetical protein [Streptomyces lavendulae]GLW04172.1 hypothetical protein Slala05_78020 [Streptomyces lavendulae subsp. lavendulae]